jgi:cytochrome c
MPQRRFLGGSQQVAALRGGDDGQRPMTVHQCNFKWGALVCCFVSVAAAILAAPVQGVAATAGPEAFNSNCRTCHSTQPGDNRLGPSLNKVIGRKAGTAPGYSNYSNSMKTSAITWDETTLDEFIANPDAVVPNNNMKPFNGVRDAAVRAKIIAFLKSTS